MKSVFLITCFLCLCAGLEAQNLVPNASFENLKSDTICWPFSGKIEFESKVENWILPNEGTTDILSTLVESTCLTHLPKSVAAPVDYFPIGNQFPRTGNNVAGIKPLSETRREYLEVELLCDLVPGKEYYCEMYVSLAEKTNYAQNSLGMYFSDVPVYVNSFAMLNFTPQIIENTIIKDTINWVKISGTFIATGTQRYLIIGSFATAAQVQTEYLGNKGMVNFPYYYIDDVLVQPVVPPSLVLTGDTTVCFGVQINLNATNWDAINWVQLNNGVATNLLGSGPNLAYYPTKSMQIKILGNKCNWPLQRIVTITVLPLPKVNLGKDTLMCLGSSFVLDAGAGFSEYLWQNGSIGQTQTVTQNGVYSVVVKAVDGCIGQDKITIGKYKKPFVNLGEDFSSCAPGGLFDVATNQMGDTFNWNDGSKSSSFQYTSEGTYWVEAINVCGEKSLDTITIKAIKMFVPNLITANDDGKNDRFEILDIEKGKGALLIYNRYGDNVYSDSAYNNNWSGEALSDGVYYFVFSYPTCKSIKGWVQIIR